MIITNELPYVKAVVEKAKAGLCYNSADPRTLARAVAQVTDDPALLRACKANALQFAKESFNWQKCGDVFLQLYAGDSSGQFASGCRHHSDRDRPESHVEMAR
jgi:glycosyltransferase involved in cell wall biosynthesis